MALMFGALACNVPVWRVEYRFAEITKQLIEMGSRIVADLKEYIFKEDNIPYPTVLKVLEEFEDFGYCC